MKMGGGSDQMQHGSMSGMKTESGMDVNQNRAAATSVYEGTTYYFCAPGCKKAFEADPVKYLGGSGKMEKGTHDSKHGGGCC